MLRMLKRSREKQGKTSDCYNNWRLFCFQRQRIHSLALQDLSNLQWNNLPIISSMYQTQIVKHGLMVAKVDLQHWKKTKQKSVSISGTPVIKSGCPQMRHTVRCLVYMQTSIPLDPLRCWELSRLQWLFQLLLQQLHTVGLWDWMRNPFLVMTQTEKPSNQRNWHLDHCDTCCLGEFSSG